MTWVAAFQNAEDVLACTCSIRYVSGADVMRRPLSENALSPFGRLRMCPGERYGLYGTSAVTMRCSIQPSESLMSWCRHLGGRWTASPFSTS